MPRAKKPAAAAKKHAETDHESDGSDHEAAHGTDGTESGWHTEGSQEKKRMPLLVTDKYAAMTLPRLRRFEPSEMKLDATVIAIGKRRTGKSWAFRHSISMLASASLKPMSSTVFGVSTCPPSTYSTGSAP